jgi:sulfite reductase alpha subunit-like flavoprotein
MGKDTNKFLDKIGCKSVYKYGEGDDNCSLEEDFEEWKKNIWVELKAHAV